MNYQIKFMFIDGKDIRVSIALDRVERFFEAINSHKIYWVDDELDSGFWLPVDKIRYIRLRKEDDEGNKKGAGKVSKIADLIGRETEDDLD